MWIEFWFYLFMNDDLKDWLERIVHGTHRSRRSPGRLRRMILNRRPVIGATVKVGVWRFVLLIIVEWG